MAGIPTPARERGKIAPTKLAHFVLQTSRYDELRVWWSTVLEAEPLFTSATITFLTYDDEHHRLALVNVAGLTERPGGVAGLDHVAFTYGGLDELLATYTRLRAAGIEPYWCIHHGPTISFYYRDPDGNQVELQVEAFDTPEDLASFFESGTFDANPIGVPVDPDDLLARREAGEPLDSVRAYPAS